MTRPIDVGCPTCGALAGRACVNGIPFRDDSPFRPGRRVTLDYHHAERVDAAMDERRGTILDRSLRPDPGPHEGSWKMIGFPGTLTNEQHEVLLRIQRAARDLGEEVDVLRAALESMADRESPEAHVTRQAHDLNAKSKEIRNLKGALAEALDDLENFVNGLAKNVGEDGGVRIHRKRIAELRKLVKP
jgi:hypothetical protein